MEMAVLDLGSLSFKLLHVRLRREGRLVRVGLWREPVTLGAAVAARQTLDRLAWDQALGAVDRLASRARRLRPDRLIAAATSAIRDAANGQDFAEEVRARSGLDLEVLGAEEEARVTFLGARSELASPFSRVAVADLGGGSLDLAVGESDPSLFACSLPLGVERLRQTFTPGRLPGPADLEAMRSLLRASLQPVARLAGGFQPDKLVFASGAARTLRRFAITCGLADQGSRVLTGKAMAAIRERTGRASARELRDRGVPPSRVGTVAIAALTLELLVELFAIDEVTISRRGLREGLALRALRSKDFAGAGARHLALAKGVMNGCHHPVADRSHSCHKGAG